MTAQPPLQTLFVWDFDWTIVNCNSDEYVPAQFLGHGATQDGFRELLLPSSARGGDDAHADVDWHRCVEVMVGRAVTETGASVRDVLDAAAKMPYLTEVRAAIQDVANASCSNDDADNNEDADNNNNNNNRHKVGQMILSDGNTLFISSYLEANGMDTAFNEGIMTNIGSFTTDDGDGTDSNSNSYDPSATLRVVHQSAKYGGHVCQRCARSPNLCKTQALRDKLNQLTMLLRPKQIVYVGDGANDVCPALNVLGEDDVLLARGGAKRREANDRSGAETDEEARDRLEGASDGSKFGILSTLKRAAEKGEIPRCRVLEWQTGSELRTLIGRCLEDATLVK